MNLTLLMSLMQLAVGLVVVTALACGVYLLRDFHRRGMERVRNSVPTKRREM